jgi:CO/xanthine dehydrogenase FAD-binding subunit
VKLQYLRINSIEDLLWHINDPNARVICGGTDLVVKMRRGIIAPGRLLDVSGVEELREIQRQEGDVIIGAAVKEEELLSSEIVTAELPLLKEVLSKLGSVQIRNRGTLGGNLVNASPAADGAIPLILYDSTVITCSANGEREVPIEDFLRGPGQTALAKGEFLSAIKVPIPSREFHHFFHKVGRRKALTIAIASLGALARIIDGVVYEVRLAAGSVAPTPIRLHRVEKLLSGNKIDKSLIAAARRLTLQTVAPIDDIRASAEYRRQVIADLLVEWLKG